MLLLILFQQVSFQLLWKLGLPYTVEDNFLLIYLEQAVILEFFIFCALKICRVFVEVSYPESY